MPHVSPIVITKKIYKDTHTHTHTHTHKKKERERKESHHVTTKSQWITKQDSKKDKEEKKSYKKGKSC